MRVGLLTAIFGDLSGYFYGNFRDKEITPAISYDNMLPLVGYCKMNDL